MELRQYLKILLGKWWIIIPLTLAGFTFSLVFSYSQNPIYEATSTYVVTLDSSLYRPDDVSSPIYGFETISGNEQRIFVTYCNVLTSYRVLDGAYQLLRVDRTQVNEKKYQITCSNLPETNVLQLTVRGTSPRLVQDLNAAIGIVGKAHTNSLYSFFPMETLDPVVLEEDPVSPKYPQNAVLGSAIGLMLGISFAFLLEYFQSPSARLEALSIRHAQMGVYNERYFRQRFEQEINRAHARNRPISMALLNLIPNEDFRLLPETAQITLYRLAALMIEDRLGKDNIVAYIKPQTFGILLAETPAHDAQAILEKLHAEIRVHPFDSDGYATSFVANSGLVASSGAALDYFGMLDKANEALKIANKTGENTIHLIRAMPLPFVLPEMEQPAADLGFAGSTAFDEMAWSDMGRDNAEIMSSGGLSTRGGTGADSISGVRRASNGQSQGESTQSGTKPRAARPGKTAATSTIEKSLLTRLREDLSRASQRTDSSPEGSSSLPSQGDTPNYENPGN